jgi:hypothetical protein
MVLSIALQVLLHVPGTPGTWVLPVPTDEAGVRAWLESSSHRENAWALYLAGERGWRQFIHPLVETAKTPDDLSYWAIDSLIRLNAKVPIEVVRNAWPKSRAAALILVARNPAHVREFLPTVLSETLRNEEWLAVNNLLVAARSNKVAFPLMQGLRISQSILVRDSGFGIGEIPSIGVDSSIECGVSGMPNDYPPTPCYQLSPQRNREDAVLAPGYHPIYYSRTFDYSAPRIAIDRDATTIEYLGTLLESPLDLQSEQRQEINWRGPRQFMIELGRIRAQLWARYREITDCLIAGELLTEREADVLQFEVRWHFSDVREKNQTALPIWPHRELLTYR